MNIDIVAFKIEKKTTNMSISLRYLSTLPYNYFIILEMLSPFILFTHSLCAFIFYVNKLKWVRIKMIMKVLLGALFYYLFSRVLFTKFMVYKGFFFK